MSLLFLDEPEKIDKATINDILSRVNLDEKDEELLHAFSRKSPTWVKIVNLLSEDNEKLVHQIVKKR